MDTRRKGTEQMITERVTDRVTEADVLREAVVAKPGDAREAEGKASFLGYLVYYTIAGARVTREDLAGAFEDAGIDPGHLPRPINSRDAFRKATRAVEVRRARVEEGEDGVRYVNVLVRDVRTSGAELVRHVVRETVDSENKRLSYVPAYELALAGEANGAAENAGESEGVLPTVAARPLVADILDEERDLVAQVARAFEIEREHYDSRAVRRLVTAILKESAPVNLTESGGVYFVPRDGGATVRSLEALVEALRELTAGGRRSKFEVHYFVDKEEYREDLEDHLEEQIREEAGSLMDELSGILRGGSRITGRRQAGFIERFRGLKKTVEKYRGILESELAGTTTSLELAEKQMMEMMLRVEVKP